MDLDSNAVLKRLFDKKSLLDVCLEVEGFLDSLNLYVYPNWIDGQIVQGPVVSRYWITLSLKYHYKKMPDPRAIKILNRLGCFVEYTELTENTPIKVRTPADFRPGTKKPRLVPEKFWLVELKIPRKFIDETDLEDLETIDQDVDVDDIQDANDEGIGEDEVNGTM